MDVQSRIIKYKVILLISISILSILSIFLNIKIHSEFYREKQIKEFRDTILLDSLDLNSKITNTEIFSVIKNVAKRSEVMNGILSGALPKELPAILKIIVDLKEDYNASIVYVMDKNGFVIASTPYDKGATLTGENYSFRPYFTSAMRGEAAIYPAVGVTTGKRGLYYSAPVFDMRTGHSGEVVGVLVAKMDLEMVDIFINRYNSPSAVVSSSGIVFSSNIDEWMFKYSFGNGGGELRNLDTETQFNTVFPRHMPEILPFSFKSKNVVYKNKKYSVLSSPLLLLDEYGEWQLVFLKNFNKWYLFLQPWLITLFIICLYIFISILIIQYSKKIILELDKKVSEEELRGVIASMDDLLFVLDTKNIFINYYQPRLDYKLYAPSDFFIGKSLRETMPPHIARLAEEAIDSVKNTGNPHQFDYSLDMEGELKWYSAKVSKMNNLSGGYAGVTVVVRDISNLKKIEFDLKKSKNIAEEANRAKSDFLANMSHEIRTPMNAIIGFTELLFSKEEDSEKKSKLGMIKTSGENLLSLINDILDFSKIEAGKIDIENKIFSLRSSLDNLYSMYRRRADEKSLEYTIKIDKLVPEYVFGDEHRIIQILTNIIGNALKFTKNGNVVIDLIYENGIAVIKITDTGIGIPEEKLESIFSVFLQADSSTEREFGGTGLGLAISRELAEFLGGSLSVMSTEGLGSVFVLKFPLPEVEVKDEKCYISGDTFNTPGIDDNTRNYNSKYRILIAEDNKINQALIKAMLNELGFECEITENGKFAIERLKSQQYDLFFLDIQMPVMDGLETIKYIREDNDLKKLYVIALTANALVGDAEKYIEAGCNDYISKPIDREVLKNKIAGIFGAKI